MAYIREYSPGGGCMSFPSIKSSYAYIWWLGLLRVVQALKVIILPLPVSAGVMCCPPFIFKPSLGRREKLPQRVGRREIYRPVPPPSNDVVPEPCHGYKRARTWLGSLIYLAREK